MCIQSYQIWFDFSERSLISIFIFQLQFNFNITLYWFQVSSIVVTQSHIFQSGPPNISSPHLTPYVVITILWTIFPVLRFTSSRLLCNRNLYLSVPSPFSSAPQPPPLWQLSVCSLYLWVCFNFVCSFIFPLDSTYKWNHRVFFFCLTYFI